MKFFLEQRTHLLLTMAMFCSTASQACYANQASQTSVRTYRLVGWQNQLTAANPNLGNFYWEPQYKRIINTTRTTLKGATEAPRIVPSRTSHYVKPIHVMMPGADSASYLTNSNLTSNSILRSDSATTGRLSVSGRASNTSIMSYQNTEFSNKPFCNQSTAASYTTKESVFGVVRNGARLIR